ncbi:12585_t:CDS:2, partial [Entrophospora sp. SA101]
MTVKLTSLPKNFQLPKSVAILTCNLFAFIFVAGLYLSKKTRIGDRQNHLLTKDHPRVILERVISVVITCFISVIIIWRLILNYEGFSEMEGSVIELELQVLKQSKSKGVLTRVSVKDHSKGFRTDEEISELFKPYSKTNSSIGSRFHAQGLSMALAQAIIKVMGGRLTVDKITKSTQHASRVWFDIWILTEDAKYSIRESFDTNISRNGSSGGGDGLGYVLFNSKFGSAPSSTDGRNLNYVLEVDTIDSDNKAQLRSSKSMSIAMPKRSHKSYKNAPHKINSKQSKMTTSGEESDDDVRSSIMLAVLGNKSSKDANKSIMKDNNSNNNKLKDAVNNKSNNALGSGGSSSTIITINNNNDNNNNLHLPITNDDIIHNHIQTNNEISVTTTNSLIENANINSSNLSPGLPPIVTYYSGDNDGQEELVLNNNDSINDDLQEDYHSSPQQQINADDNKSSNNVNSPRSSSNHPLHITLPNTISITNKENSPSSNAPHTPPPSSHAPRPPSLIINNFTVELANHVEVSGTDNVKVDNGDKFWNDDGNNDNKVIYNADDIGYCCILMDIITPVMNGYEATKLLRDNGIDIPILALTANSFGSDVKKSTEVGMDAFLTKPINETQLINAINKEIENYKNNKLQHQLKKAVEDEDEIYIEQSPQSLHSLSKGFRTDEEISELFKPYSKTNSSIGSRFHAQGLSMALAQAIIKVMGGRLTVDKITKSTQHASRVWFDIWILTEDAKYSIRESFDTNISRNGSSGGGDGLGYVLFNSKFGSAPSSTDGRNLNYVLEVDTIDSDNKAQLRSSKSMSIAMPKRSHKSYKNAPHKINSKQSKMTTSGEESDDDVRSSIMLAVLGNKSSKDANKSIMKDNNSNNNKLKDAVNNKSNNALGSGGSSSTIITINNNNDNNNNLHLPITNDDIIHNHIQTNNEISVTTTNSLIENANINSSNLSPGLPPIVTYYSGDNDGQEELVLNNNDSINDDLQEDYHSSPQQQINADDNKSSNNVNSPRSSSNHPLHITLPNTISITNKENSPSSNAPHTPPPSSHAPRPPSLI